MPLTLAAVAAAPQIIKGIGGIFKNAKGKKLAKQNEFPDEAVNQNIIQNSAEADQMAQTGMPQAQYKNQQQAINTNQAGAVRLLANGNMPNSSLSSLTRAGNDATATLNSQDAVDRQQNQRFAIGQRGLLANEQNRVWDWNKRQRYLQNARAAAEYMRSGSQDISGALDNVSSIGQIASSTNLSMADGRSMLKNGQTFGTGFLGGAFNPSYTPRGGASGNLKFGSNFSNQMNYNNNPSSGRILPTWENIRQ
jgi:hypothetical protein